MTRNGRSSRESGGSIESVSIDGSLSVGVDLTVGHDGTSVRIRSRSDRFVVSVRSFRALRSVRSAFESLPIDIGRGVTGTDFGVPVELRVRDATVGVVDRSASVRSGRLPTTALQIVPRGIAIAALRWFSRSDRAWAVEDRPNRSSEP